MKTHTKRILSCLLIVATIISVVPFVFSANAATPKKNCFQLTSSGVQHNSLIKGVIDKVNAARVKRGYPKLTFDSQLQKVAQDRAADIVFAHDWDEEILPDGRNLKAILPQYPSSVEVEAGSLYQNPFTVDNVYSYANDIEYSTYKDFRYVGLAVYEYKGVRTYYWAVSTKKLGSTFTDFYDVNYKRVIDINYNNISTMYLQQLQANKRGAYKLFLKVSLKGYYNDFFYMPYNWIYFVSSKPSIYKIKQYEKYHFGFAKYNGKAFITVNDKNGVKLNVYEVETYGNYSKPDLSTYSSGSKAKKSLYCKWYKYSGCDGYQLQYTTDKNFKKNVKLITIRNGNKDAYTIKNLASGKTYYVRIRLFVAQGLNEYQFSAWGPRHGFKIK